MTTVGYFHVGGEEMLSAEVAEHWPRDCAVCLHERDKLVSIKSRTAALKHRKVEHGWLHAALKAERSAR